MEAYKILSEDKENITSLSKSIIKVMNYFDVFDFSLTDTELHQYCDHANMPFHLFKEELELLASKGYIKKHKQYYYLGHFNKGIKREQNIDLYQRFFKKAKFFSRIISWFPFVRSIAISGSLSKGDARVDGDIDYFIITQRNRLWLCKTLLTLFKKIFLFNSHKYFCINYFVDIDNLDIQEKNLFTATEIAFLLPTYNYRVFNQFLLSNAWYRKFYPNKGFECYSDIPSHNFLHKKLVEKLFGSIIGTFFENCCRSVHIYYKKKKYNKLTPSEFNSYMKSTNGVSKHHPDSFQSRVISAYHNKLHEYASTWSIGL